MTPTRNRWQSVGAIFYEALAMSPADRVKLLADRCGDNGALRTEVESLLQSHDRLSDSFMQIDGHGGWRESSPTADECDQFVGVRIGQYIIRTVINRGGMGTVFLAAQEQPRRDVALKLMKNSIASRSELKRFEFESQILARLKHPNIAQVYDAGTHAVDAVTGRGLPYFVMEYVPGAKPITKFAAESQLSIPARLELYALVCDAVHHGHLRDVIHRDLKPSNIIVDKDGVVKIIDFGVAKLTDADPAGTTMHTGSGDLLGTLPYMSPEQCGANPDDLDKRSDVYALGVVLYELLCGRLPYDVNQKSVVEVAKTIQDQPPRKLSAVSRVLRGDVETIVAKTLAKEQKLRYQSAEELSQDLHRYLNNRPILARPPTSLYRLRKFVQRNPGKVSTAAAAAFTIAFTLTLSIVGYIRESRRAEVLSREKYENQIALSQQAYRLNNSQQMKDALGMCDPAFRDWEWHYLSRLADQSIATLPGHDADVRSVDVSPDGELIASGSGDRTIRIWDYLTGACLRTLDGHTNVVNCVRFSPDGNRVASSSTDSTVRIWRVSTGEQIVSYRGHEHRVDPVVFSPDGSLVASADQLGKIEIWETDTGRRVRSFNAHHLTVSKLAWTDDDEHIISACTDLTIRTWSVATGNLINEIKTTGDSVSLNVIEGAKGRLIASNDFGNVVVRDAVTGDVVVNFSGHSQVVCSLASTPDRKILISGSMDRTVRLWSLESGKPISTLKGHNGGVLSCAVNDKAATIVTGGDDGQIKIWDPRVVGPSTSLSGHYGTISALKFSPDGSKLASAGADQTIIIWDATSTAMLQSLNSNAGIYSLAWGPDSRVLAVGDGRGVVRVWDTETADVLFACPGKRNTIRSVTFRPTHRNQLALADRDGRIEVWDLETETILFGITDKSGDLRALAYSVDGATLASARGRSVFFHDARTGELVGEPWLLARKVTTLTYGNHGRRLFVACEDKTIKTWDVVAKRPIEPEFVGHIGKVVGIDQTRDGKRLISCAEDGTVRLWDIAIGRGLLTLPTSELANACVAANPNRMQIAAAGQTGEMEIWEADPPIGGELDERNRVLTARAIVVARLESLSLAADVAESIRRDVTLAPALRDTALDALERRRDNVKRLEHMAWKKVEAPTDDPDKCLRAIQFARAALDSCDTSNVVVLHTLGVAQFRAAMLGVGTFDDALKTLEETTRLRGHPQDLAFLAMTLYQLDRHAQARARFKEVDLLMTMDEHRNETHFKRFQNEARQMIFPGKAKSVVHTMDKSPG
ncbi:MAG: protein kinase [Phycisphaerales bacterium]|nr:protein kinase [Phycisphaerales bacterium]